MKLMALCAALLLWSSRPTVVATGLPHGAVSYHDTTGAYEQWWRDTQRCASKRALVPFSFVDFYVVDTANFGSSIGGTVVAALAYPEYSTIVVASPWIRDSMIVRHEMLHLVLAKRNHDPEYFQRRCQREVICMGACLRDTL